MKKFPVFLCVAILLVSVLTACGGDGQSSSSAESSSAPESSSSAPVSSEEEVSNKAQYVKDGSYYCPGFSLELKLPEDWQKTTKELEQQASSEAGAISSSASSAPTAEADICGIYDTENNHSIFFQISEIDPKVKMTDFFTLYKETQLQNFLTDLSDLQEETFGGVSYYTFTGKYKAADGLSSHQKYFLRMEGTKLMQIIETAAGSVPLGTVESMLNTAGSSTSSELSSSAVSSAMSAETSSNS